MTDLNQKQRIIIAKAAAAVKDRGHEGDAKLADSLNGILAAAAAEVATPAPQAAPSDTGNSAKHALHIMSQAYNLGWREGGDEGAWEFVTRTSYETGWNDAVERHAAAPASLTPAPQGTASDEVIGILLEVARAAYDLMDNTEERGTRGNTELIVQYDDFSVLSEAMDKLDALPDDQPGYAMGPAAKAEWAIEKSRAASLTQAATSEPVAPSLLDELRATPKVAIPAWKNHEDGTAIAAPAAAHPAPSDVLTQARGALNAMVKQFTRTPSTGADSEARKLAHAAIAAIDTALAAPTGWKLVPIEPTDAMVMAPGAVNTGGNVARIHREVWRRMLEAVPAPVCTVPPDGWICTRAAGHDGPCAALPAQQTPSDILTECKRFLEDMHAMPVDWTIKESQTLHTKVSAALSAQQAGGQEAPSDEYAAELDSIGKSIGYGRACQILGELWDQMLERAYGRPSSRGKMERRRDIEEIEALLKSRAALSASSAVTNEDAKEKTLPEGFTLAPVAMPKKMRDYLQDRLHSPICKADVVWNMLLKMGLGMEDE